MNSNLDEDISVESAFLLVYASRGDGHITKVRTYGPTLISTSGKNFIANESHRESVRWTEALQSLIELGFVSSVGYKGQIFELTNDGYSKADVLIESMKIDVSKEPIEELKKFLIE